MDIQVKTTPGTGVTPVCVGWDWTLAKQRERGVRQEVGTNQLKEGLILSYCPRE